MANVRVTNNSINDSNQQRDAMVLELKRALLGKRGNLAARNAAIDVINDADSNTVVHVASEDDNIILPAPGDLSPQISQPPAAGSDGNLKKTNKTMKRKWLALWTLFLWWIGSYTIDIVLDIIILHQYLKSDEWWFFGLTFFFVFFPAIVISYLNGKYYTEKWEIKCKIEKTRDQYKLKNVKMLIDTNARFRLRAFLCLFLVSPIAR